MTKRFMVSTEKEKSAQKRMNFVLKPCLLLIFLMVHTSLVAFLLNCFGFALWGGSRSNMPGSDGLIRVHSHGGHTDGLCQTDSTHHRYGFEGAIPAIYKDPSAEFSRRNPWVLHRSSIVYLFSLCLTTFCNSSP